MVAVYQHEQFTQKIRVSMLDNAQVVASRFGSHKSQIGGVRWNEINPQGMVKHAVGHSMHFTLLNIYTHSKFCSFCRNSSGRRNSFTQQHICLHKSLIGFIQFNRHTLGINAVFTKHISTQFSHKGLSLQRYSC